MKDIIPINTDKDGNAKCIANHYHKAGGNDFLFGIGKSQNSCHTAILEIWHDD